MSNCCGGSCGSGGGGTGGGLTPRQADYRRVLRMAVFVNALMFVIELTASFDTQSIALRADALNFLKDALNYGVSLWVLGKSLEWRGRASLVKGLALVGMGLWVLGCAAWNGWAGTVPDAPVMSLVGLLALGANVSVAALLFAGRRGGTSLRSVWLCARNGALANLAVMAAAAGVWNLGQGWPDILIAVTIAVLSLSAAFTALRQAAAERRAYNAPPPGGAFSTGP